MDYKAIEEEAARIAAANADRMYPDRNSKTWEAAFEDRMRREYRLMIAPPNN